MTQLIPDHNVFSEPTRTSVKTWVPSTVEEARPATSTLPPRAQVVEISGFKESKQRRGFKSIDQVVDRLSEDPQQRSEIESARKWLADTFYSNEINSLRALRLSKGLSQAELAKRIETKQAHIARIEAGNNVEVETLVKLARALEVNPIALFAAFIKRYDVTK